MTVGALGLRPYRNVEAPKASRAELVVGRVTCGTAPGQKCGIVQKFDVRPNVKRCALLARCTSC